MGLYLIIKKTKAMMASDNGTVNKIIDNERMQPVQDFLFLGSKLDRNGESGPEIKRRIALGRSTMQEMVKIWKLETL